MCRVLLFFLAATLWSQNPVGVYLGELNGMMGKLRLGLEVKQGADGKLNAEMISIDQAYARMAAKSTTLDGKTLKVALAAVNASFEGDFSEDGQTISGKFNQGMALDLVFKRVATLPVPNRPQEPKPPFPYKTEEVSFPGGAENVTLAGTFTRPSTGAKFTTVVLVTGSGPQDRDEAIAMHKPFLVLSDHLTRAGFAVLRYDDRGTAKSTGSFKGSTSVDFAKDTLGAIHYLRGRKEVERIVVLGHSEGGMIAPMVANLDGKLAGIVLLAGPAVTGEQILRRQLPDLNRAAGMNEEMAAANARMNLDAMIKRKDEDAWLANFWTYDPAPELAKLSCPVLALNGELDMQVSAEVNLKVMREQLKNNKRATVMQLPKLNHLFQTAQTGGPQEYGKLEETISPLALNTISDWLKKL